MKRDLKFDEERQFEKDSTAGVDLPHEILKLYRLRRLISKAWIPLGISREEGADILIWAVGEDVAHLNFLLWPERIKENVGLTFDIKQAKIIDVLRLVAGVWQKKKVKPYYTGV